MAKFEAAIGRYVWLEIQGVEYRVYFEEAGQGIPLICQHTAGSDGKQWRHFLTDPDITSRFRVIVPDLPYHGKSLPPESQEWWAQEYRLTKSFFIDFHLALKRALDCEKPVFIGSSMGGHLAPDLALACPDEYAAVIGLEAGLKTGVGTDDDIRAAFRYFRHPRVNGADRAAAAMYCINGPRSPEKYKREVAWSYSQGAPGAFAGDLNYYNIEHDLRETAHLIDTALPGLHHERRIRSVHRFQGRRRTGGEDQRRRVDSHAWHWPFPDDRGLSDDEAIPDAGAGRNRRARALTGDCRAGNARQRIAPWDQPGKG